MKNETVFMAIVATIFSLFMIISFVKGEVKKHKDNDYIARLSTDIIILYVKNLRQGESVSDYEHEAFFDALTRLDFHHGWSEDTFKKDMTKIDSEDNK